MDQQTTDAAASANDTSSIASATTDAPKAAPAYTKDDLTRIVSREVGAVSAKLKAAEERLAALDEAQRVAEEAKLSAVQRQELERKREREGYEAKLSALTDTAKRERESRQSIMRQHAASGVVAKVAQRLFNPEIAPHVERLVADRVVVETADDGTERLALQMGAPGDTEPFNDATVQKFADAHLTPFFKAQGGSGAQHGTGTSGRLAATAISDPTSRIAAGLNNRK